MPYARRKAKSAKASKKASKPARKAVKRDPNVPRPYCSGQWSSSRFFSFIRSALRNASTRWSPSIEALKDAATTRKINVLTGRLAQHYRCWSCLGEFPRTGVAIDHIVPVGTLRSFDDLPGFAQRLFQEKDGYQVLCCACHEIKTAKDNEALKALRS
jgi:hypothetical protein